MTDHVISGLVRKRAELAGQIAQLQEDLRHIDGALIVLGYSNPQSIDAIKRRRLPAMFRAGELMRLVGDALREGHAKPHQITLYVMERRGMDHQDVDLLGRVKASVRACVKRMNRNNRPNARLI
ncbi:hypothetical protein K1X12_12730 [Hyphomonas sp. WL0036]|uniref:hypothetical protein n=1 Tax=Hyphomonas sediminis TaxID=2866160 RepID=UPI001C7EEC64|nr:hypothetical protein [Hyphomonas sediminis]MBY9067770.1 hypothetical protein [Hyphomonas sediminis]